jgi:aldose 1-epimerase
MDGNYLTTTERLSLWVRDFWERRLLRSGMVTGLVLAGLVLALAFAYRERGTGHLTKLKVKIGTEDQFQETPSPRPGGQEATLLTRSRLIGSSMPEFLTMTLLPGRGMNVLQITAYIPDKGEVSLLASPAVDQASSAMSGKDADAGGQASLTMGGAFEVPWAGGIYSGGGGGNHVTANWRGHTITLPTARTDFELPVAEGGLILAETSNSKTLAAMPDGGQTQAVFNSGDFGDHWPSKTEVTIGALLGGHSIELTVEARNTGDAALPVGIGWHPRFSISQQSREQMKLRLPGDMRLETRDRRSGLPTGRVVPVAGAFDYVARAGTRLGDAELNDTFVQLHQELLDNGPVAELSDPSNNYGLRITALTPTIKAFHVEAPAQGGFISIEPRYNFDDPFGREWANGTDTGMVVLQPGQSTMWKVRLELYSLTRTGPPI